MNFKKTFSMLIIFMILATMFTGCTTQKSTENPSTDQNLKTGYNDSFLSSLQQSIRAAEDYLIKATNEDGMFTYIYHPSTDKKSTVEYNMLRHAGTIYAMMIIYNETGNPQILSSAEKAIQYLINQIHYYNDTRCLIYNDIIKLGGTALTLLALAEYTLVTGNQEYISLMNDLGRYLLISQKETGEFIHYRTADKKQILSYKSEYYPGEAIFSLSKLYEIDNNQTWITAAQRNAEYLINQRKQVSITNLTHDHWLLLAFNQLNQYQFNQNYIDHAVNITKSILIHQRNDITRQPEEKAWLGSYYTPPRSTPTATRSEGLLASYQLLKDNQYNETFLQKIMYAVNLSVHFQLGMQYTHDNTFRFPNPTFAIGGFKESIDNQSIRIDYVQHNICSIITYYQILKEDPSIFDDINTIKGRYTESILDCDILEESLQLGTSFLLQNQKVEGNFQYEYQWINQSYTQGDNEVRQAGALWGLTRIHQYYPTDELRNGIINGLDYFLNHSTSEDDMSWVQYPASGTYSVSGTVALVSLSIIDFLRSNPTISTSFEQELKNQLRKYITFLQSLRMENGLFHQVYLQQNGTGIGPSSPYADGEILLSFIKSYNYLGYTDLKQTIIESAYATYQAYIIEALNQDPDSNLTKGFFQWGIMAYYEILQTSWSQIKNYSSVIIGLADWMIDIHETLERTKNTGYAYEGIIYAYDIAKTTDDSVHIEKFEEVIDTGLSKLISWQIGSSLANNFIKDHSTTDPLALGGVMNHAYDPTLRIDVTQHQMHAVLLALNYVYDCM